MALFEPTFCSICYLYFLLMSSLLHFLLVTQYLILVRFRILVGLYYPELILFLLIFKQFCLCNFSLPSTNVLIFIVIITKPRRLCPPVFFSFLSNLHLIYGGRWFSFRCPCLVLSLVLSVFSKALLLVQFLFSLSLKMMRYPWIWTTRQVQSVLID